MRVGKISTDTLHSTETKFKTKKKKNLCNESRKVLYPPYSSYVRLPFVLTKKERKIFQVLFFVFLYFCFPSSFIWFLFFCVFIRLCVWNVKKTERKTILLQPWHWLDWLYATAIFFSVSCFRVKYLKKK